MVHLVVIFYSVANVIVWQIKKKKQCGCCFFYDSTEHLHFYDTMATTVSILHFTTERQKHVSVPYESSSGIFQNQKVQHFQKQTDTFNMQTGSYSLGDCHGLLPVSYTHLRS